MITKYTALTFLMLLVLLAGCGEQEPAVTESEQAAEPAVAEETAEIAEPEPMSVEQMAEEIIDIYMNGLNEVAAMTKDAPPAEEVMPQLETLKENMITRLVEYGRMRLDLTDAERSSLDMRLGSKLSSIPMDIFTAYSEAQKPYLGTPTGNLIASFNIITQYADFELLKKQLPEEAARLGIY